MFCGARVPSRDAINAVAPAAVSEREPSLGRRKERSVLSRKCSEQGAAPTVCKTSSATVPSTAQHRIVIGLSKATAQVRRLSSAKLLLLQVALENSLGETLTH